MDRVFALTLFSCGLGHFFLVRLLSIFKYFSLEKYRAVIKNLLGLTCVEDKTGLSITTPVLRVKCF